jgi:RNA polymerase sigma factor (sigma-70 family)
MRDDELRALVNRLQRGEREAFSEFLLAYGGVLRAMARRRLVQLRLQLEIEPDEIVGATMLEVWCRRQHLSAESSSRFLAYIKRIIRWQVNRAWRRKRTRRRGRGGVLGLTLGPAEIPDPRGQVTDEWEWDDAIRSAYDELSAHERLVAMMRRGGWTWDEIAARVRATPDGVRKIWERAAVRVLRKWV